MKHIALFSLLSFGMIFPMEDNNINNVEPNSASLEKVQLMKTMFRQMHLSGSKRSHYECIKCDKIITDRIRHIRQSHTGYQPYQCPTCQKKFTESGNCVKHIATYHEEIEKIEYLVIPEDKPAYLKCSKSKILESETNSSNFSKPGIDNKTTSRESAEKKTNEQLFLEELWQNPQNTLKEKSQSLKNADNVLKTILFFEENIKSEFPLFPELIHFDFKN